MAIATYSQVSWERVNNAVENVRRRLLRAASALGQAKIPYAVAGGKRRGRLGLTCGLKPRCETRRMWTLYCAGQICMRHARRWNMPDFSIVTQRAWTCFSTGQMRKRARRLTLFFAAERVRPDYPTSAPDVFESEETETFRLLSLDALVRMKLTSFHDKDRMHLRDLMGVGLVDEGWLERIPAALRARLQALLDNPEG